MSTYFKKGKGWRYDFTLQKKRHASTYFKTMAEAKRAEAIRKEELKNPPPATETPTDMAFSELLNRRLDYVLAYKCHSYYQEHIYLAKRLMKIWHGRNCGDITTQMVLDYLIKRGKESVFAANRDLRYLRAAFNFGIKQGLIKANPTNGLEFMPVERRLKYVPSKEDVAKVLLAADPDVQNYLVAIVDTMGRMGEINRLAWEDVDFERRVLVLYTRKKKGGHLTPRKVPMTNRLFQMLLKRHKTRDKEKPWVFWQRYWSRKAGHFVDGPYQDRKAIMRILCQKAGVKYFRFHALRHFGASVMDSINEPIGHIQRILGHENRTTTEIYLHSIGEGERQAMDRYEQACQPDYLEENLTQNLTQ